MVRICSHIYSRSIWMASEALSVCKPSQSTQPLTSLCKSGACPRQKVFMEMNVDVEHANNATASSSIIKNSRRTN